MHSLFLWTAELGRHLPLRRRRILPQMSDQRPLILQLPLPPRIQAALIGRETRHLSVCLVECATIGKNDRVLAAHRDNAARELKAVNSLPMLAPLSRPMSAP